MLTIPKASVWSQTNGVPESQNLVKGRLLGILILSIFGESLYHKRFSGIFILAIPRENFYRSEQQQKEFAQGIFKMQNRLHLLYRW